MTNDQISGVCNCYCYHTCQCVQCSQQNGQQMMQENIEIPHQGMAYLLRGLI